MEEKKHFYSLCIMRNMKQSGYSFYVREFFKFCGVSVWEYIIDEGENREIDKRKADVVLDIDGSGNGLPVVQFGRVKYILELDGQSLDTFIEPEFFSIKIESMIKAVSQWIQFDERLPGIFGKLADIFSEQNYAKKNYIAHCFLHQIDLGKQLTFAQMYYDCYLKLCEYNKELESNGIQSEYVRYALLNCARKVNSVCTIHGDLEYFDQRDMLKMAGSFLIDNDVSGGKFTAGYFLAGIIGISKSYLWEKGVKYLEEAVEKEKSQNIGYIAYALGHYYEIEKKDFEKAWKYYEKILDVMPDYYRAEFKRGCKTYREGNYDEAYTLFQTLGEKLAKKVQTDWAEPIEWEYLYKCEKVCALLCQHYLNRESVYEDNHEQLAKSTLKTEKSNWKFIEQVFQEEKEDILRYHKDKILGYDISHIIGV